MKKIHCTYLSFIIVISIVSSCSMEYCVGKMEKPKESVVTFQGITFNGNACYNWDFRDENKKGYLIDDGSKVGKYDIGTKYVIIYDSLNPSTKYYIDYSRPIILSNEAIVTLPCEVINSKVVYPNNRLKTIGFIFYINQKLEYGGQYIRAPKNDTIILKKGDRYLVDVCKSNPYRTIIHLDKPLIDRRPLEEYTRIYTDSIKHHHNHSTH